MSIERVDKIAKAVLYEGYVLYPYRPSSVKNRQRFNFGVLYPREYSEWHQGSDNWRLHTECLITGTAQTEIEVRARFLQLSERDGWQQGYEREIIAPATSIELLTANTLRRTFLFSTRPEAPESSRALEAELQVSAQPLRDGIWRIAVEVSNSAEAIGVAQMNRDEALLRSLVSVHCILRAVNGEFVSLLDPPEELREFVQGCRNEGAWPVLAGEEGERDLMLASPIILYDHPQIAPESPGDLCDSCEIDEILALRILTMTDDEKREVRAGDERARQILDRTEMLPPEHFQKLHGALRGLREVPGDSQ